MSSMRWLVHIAALLKAASILAAASVVFELDEQVIEQTWKVGASQLHTCSSGPVGIPGSSFIQKMEHAAAVHEWLPLAEQALFEDASKTRHSAGTTATSFHGGQTDRAMSDLFTVFFVVAILLFVSVLGFIFLESSSKKRPPSGPPVGDYRSMADGSGAVSPRAAALAREANLEAEPSSLYLCGPDLVVPAEKECNLVIPSIQYQYSHVERSELFINDTEGSNILRGVIFKKAQPDGTRIMLQSRDSNITWCRCIATGLRNRFKLCGRGDDPEIQDWGTIEMKQGGTLSLETSNGHKVKFEQGPSGRRKTLRLVDGYGVLLCLSEMSVGGRAVRVGPLVDIGFVMLSHLAMDVFQLEEFGELR